MYVEFHPQMINHPLCDGYIPSTTALHSPANTRMSSFTHQSALTRPLALTPFIIPPSVHLFAHQSTHMSSFTRQLIFTRSLTSMPSKFYPPFIIRPPISMISKFHATVNINPPFEVHVLQIPPALHCLPASQDAITVHQSTLTRPLPFTPSKFHPRFIFRPSINIYFEFHRPIKVNPAINMNPQFEVNPE